MDSNTTTTDEADIDLATLPDDTADLTPAERLAAAAAVLHQAERLLYALQTTIETLAEVAGVPEHQIRQIEREAVEEEGQAMDDAEAAAGT